jgi:hypothetical protein
LGTFCILDKNKRYFHTEQQETLKMFAEVVMESLELRLMAHNTLNEMMAKLADARKPAVA